MKSTTLLFLVAVLLLNDSLAKGNTEQAHTTHQRVGDHGMVMFAVGAEIYASHLPLYGAPHDFQLIYQIKSAYSERIKKLLGKGMVTILPATFDLNRLVNGERFTIPSQVFSGHFERGGSISFEDTSFEFFQPIYARKLTFDRPVTKSLNTTFTVLDTTLPNSKLIVHQIQSAPSFDMIALLSDVTCSTTTRAGLASIEVVLPTVAPLSNTSLSPVLEKCGDLIPLYFETQDFAG